MIRLEKISRHYQVGSETVNALKDFTLEIQSGDYLSVMGPSGSGKSTLLNQLGLLDTPNSGSYKINDLETTQLGEAERAQLRNKKIGFVFQAYHLIDRLTALENVELPLTLIGTDPTERKARAIELLERLGLGRYIHQRPQQLSGGQRQRIAIARAVITHPEILLADEPTGNLDQASGAKVVELLEQLNGDGITLVIVTHDSELGARARKQVKMVDGQLLEIIEA
ncbi:ABC transporter ATP-binding protein [Marinobacterium sp. LSUCC0821]|jgi:putative ABC transport system ATP-binding protein|uniref:ABC transporter ATP-binding protein n=1 Tax=Marinobacterium sp. LSUCC0821 TaxID=2668067 RepID=UPI0014511FC0|nr:ABC transporter ATP-binding protein [Marinobacterium sp. LSUCC0821]QJD70280.1 ABC transporter ATP-binding protein [Marinobacterium sp. LSUCC0821]